MKNDVIRSYENYNEENRLSTNNSRRIEFITNIRALDEIMTPNSKILDCGAGTGIYSFYFAEKGHKVTALDITPRHIDYIKNQADNKKIDLTSILGDATDLTRFEDESFDVVLIMGPLYHLPDAKLRSQCISECYRVLKNEGIMVLAYISRYAVFDYVATSNKAYINADLATKLIETGELRSTDKDCFWTDCYFSTPDEIVKDVESRGMKVLDHLASDGVTPILRNKIDDFNVSEFNIWCEHHYNICREPSILGTSNHGLLISRKIV